jgi:hypothetical protein
VTYVAKKDFLQIYQIKAEFRFKEKNFETSRWGEGTEEEFNAL